MTMIAKPRFIQFAVITEIEGNVNADEVVGSRVTVKKFVTREGVYPYVSSRAIKKGIKLALERDYNYKIDPFEKEYGKDDNRQKGDSGDFITYIDQDLFGYMLPERKPKKRKSPVELSYLISFYPIPILPEFAGRFPRNSEPIPFEIEQVKFIGKFYGIIYNYIGVVHEDEVSDDIKNREIDKTKVEKKGKLYILKDDERKNRLKALLEIILGGKFILPRSTNQLNQNYKYVIVALTKSIKPLPSFVTIKYQKEREYEIIKDEKDGKIIERVIEKFNEGYRLDIDKIKEFSQMLEDNEKIYIIDYVGDLFGQNLGNKVNIIKPSEINTTIKKIVDEEIDLNNFDYYLKFYE